MAEYKEGITKNIRINMETGAQEYQDHEGYWLDEIDVCQHCLEEVQTLDKPFRESERRLSFGYYAGRYCDSCWAVSGFRDATDPEAEFDESFAGESLHGESDAFDSEIDF